MTGENPADKNAAVPTTSSAVSDALVSYLVAAAKLRLELAPYESDRELERVGGAVFHAVDTNIVTLFLAPHLMGPAGERGDGGYGVVFPGDDRETATALAAALSRFIFWNLTGAQQPLLLLIGHDAETRSIFEAVARNTKSAIDVLEASGKSLLSLLKRLKAETVDEERISLLEQFAPELLQHLFYEKGPASELRRFSMLFTQGRLMRLSVAIRQDQFFSENDKKNRELCRLFSVPSNIGDQLEESQYRVAWRKRLQDSAASSLKEHRLRADSSALARLQLINNKISGSNQRLVLITGDQKMFAAADSYKPYENRSETFSELYLRSPRAFLAAPDVLAPDFTIGAAHSRAPILINNWLDTLLARYTGAQGVRKKEIHNIAFGDPRAVATLQRLAADVTKVDPAAADSIKMVWSEYTTYLRASHAAVSDLARAEVKRYFGVTLERETEDALLSVERRLRRTGEQSWQAFFAALMRAGYDLLSIDDLASEQRCHDVPPISFDAFVKAREFVREVLGGIVNSPAPENTLAALHDGLLIEDPTGYAGALAYAVLFAHAGRWHVARLMADRAIDIANRVQEDILEKLGKGEVAPRSETVISGREAFYFAAMCERLQVREPVGLLVAQQLLSKAERSYERDIQRNHKLSVNKARFVAERRSIEMARCMFRELLSQDNADLGKYIEPSEVMSAIAQEFQKIYALPDDWMRRRIQNSMAIEFFMGAALLDNRSSLKADLITDCMKFLSGVNELIMVEVLGRAKNLDTSWLTTAIGCYALSRFTRCLGKTKRKILDLMDNLDGVLANNPDIVIVTAYDRKRYEMLSRLTRNALD
jgi:hypothetical protein